MPTPAAFDATLAAAISNEIGVVQGMTVARMDSDISTVNEPVPAGEVRFQLQSFTLPQSTSPDSGPYMAGVLCLIRVHYKLDDTERAWSVSGAMQPLLATFTTPAWWRALAGVHYLDESPVGADVARVGNVVSFTITATVTIDPP